MKKFLFVLLFACFSAIGFAQNNVIDNDLQEILSNENDDMICVNIVMKSQIDPSSLRSRVCDIKDRKIRREVVVNELKAYAEKSQQDVLSYIKAEERSGRAKDIKTHWLSNSITCTISKDLIYFLSTHNDVAMIGSNVDKYVLSNEQAVMVDITPSVTESLMQVNADDVWAQGYTGKGVLVAVLDSGVNYNHADLADHLWDGGSQYPNHGYNTYDDNNDPLDRVSGHGTHCAGIVCGDGTSGTATGAAPDATLMCVKVISDNGDANLNSIVSGMEFAVEQGADVMSMSLGIMLVEATLTERAVLRDACVSALEAGVIAAVAAGNEGTVSSSTIPENVRVPGSCPPPWIHPDQKINEGGVSCVVSVGAVDNSDYVSYLSSRGPVTWQNTSYGDYEYDPGIGLIRPDICAPGVNIVSLDYSGNDGYIKMTGTSMATPCVAGTICLMLERDYSLTPAEICELLETSCLKLSDTKNNDSGSGRLDALAAVNAIDMGTMELKDFTINDDDGNANAALNPGENVTLDIEFQNTSSQTYSNVTATIKCDDSKVNIVKSDANIGNVAANTNFSIIDQFNFTLSSTAKSNDKLYFDVEFYSNSTYMATTRVIITVYDNTLLFSSLIIENDDNNNGILEAGETADLGVVINNTGNEIVLGLEGVLSTNDNRITINNEEAYFGPVGPDASVMAYYNITLSNGTSSDLDIPFELKMKDKYDEEYDFEVNYVSNCNIIYDLYDEFGDGWANAKITAVYSDGSTSDVYTLTNGKHATYTKNLNTGVEVVLEWKKGMLDAECSYVVSYESGVLIYSGQGTKPKGEFFRWTNNCSCQNMPIVVCDPVNNLNITAANNVVSLNWEATDTEVSFYEIYRDTKLLGTTENLSFTDDQLTANGTYYYNVRPVYENCNGALTGEEIYFGLGTTEIEDINVAVYPNPSNDRFVVKCGNMTNIVVFNLMGEEIMNVATDDDSYEINGLKSGIYFISVKSDAGNVIRKVVKY